MLGELTNGFAGRHTGTPHIPQLFFYVTCHFRFRFLPCACNNQCEFTPRFCKTLDSLADCPPEYLFMNFRQFAAGGNTAVAEDLTSAVFEKALVALGAQQDEIKELLDV